MPVSVRLDRETEAALEKVAESLGISKSAAIKESIREFCARALERDRKRPFDLLEDLVEAEGSGRGDLSVRGEEILRARFGRQDDSR